MSRSALIACLAVALVGLWSSAPTRAADTAPYASPAAAYRVGLDALQAGRVEAALDALGFAAQEGVLGARLKLAELYRTGEALERDDAKAFALYQRIADDFADVSPRDRIAPHVARSFVALAGYHRAGIDAIGLKPDPARAVRLYRHAASYFGEVSAQFALARLYLAGDGVSKNVRLAVNWLANAAKKQHAPSQALLGDLLWRGAGDIEPRNIKGLALLAVAHEAAAGSADADWIATLHDRALAQAKPNQRAQATALAVRWRGGADGVAPLARSPSPPERETPGRSVAAAPAESGAPLGPDAAPPPQLQTVGAVAPE